jgi:hypothetical protein
MQSKSTRARAAANQNSSDPDPNHPWIRTQAAPPDDPEKVAGSQSDDPDGSWSYSNVETGETLPSPPDCWQAVADQTVTRKQFCQWCWNNTPSATMSLTIFAI